HLRSHSEQCEAEKVGEGTKELEPAAEAQSLQSCLLREAQRPSSGYPEQLASFILQSGSKTRCHPVCSQTCSLIQQLSLRASVSLWLPFFEVLEEYFGLFSRLPVLLFARYEL